MTKGNDSQGPVVHDRRRIDPATGEVRESAPSTPGTAAQAAVAGVAKARAGREGGKSRKAQATKSAAGPEQAAKGADKAKAAEEAKPSAKPAEGAEEKGAAPTGEDQIAKLTATVAERTADLQRVTAEYANYRKRVERDREAVKELARAEVFAALLEALDDIGRAREHGELDGGFKSVAETLERTVQKFGVERYGEAGEPFDPMVHEALLHSYSADVSEPTCTTILQPGYRIGERILRPARVAVTEPEPYDPSGGATSE